MAPTKPLFVGVAIAFYANEEIVRQRIDDTGPHTMETTGCSVCALLKFSTGMEFGENDLQGTAFLAICGMGLNGNSPSIIFDRDRFTIGFEGHIDHACMAVYGLINSIIEDLPNEVMEAVFTHATNIHARSFTDGLEAF